MRKIVRTTAEQIVDRAVDAAGQAGGREEVEDALYEIQLEAQRRVKAR